MRHPEHPPRTTRHATRSWWIAPRRSGHGQTGFTLLELLVAIAIFSLIAVMAYGGLNAVTRQSALLAEREAAIRHMQTGLRQMELDLFQISHRPVRDELGGDLPAIGGGIDPAAPLQFTRLGLPNPLQKPRASLERVQWRRDGDQLIRLGWSPVDGRPFTRPDSADSRRVLLDELDHFELRFYDQNNEASPNWPPPNQPDAVLPKAVEIQLALRGQPRIRLTFDLPRVPVHETIPGDESGEGTESAGEEATP